MTRSLWDVLGAIADRRGRKGRQFPLQAVPAIAIAAMLAGANDLRAIFRWGRRLKPEALALFGIERAPCHATYHYVFRSLDGDALARALGGFAAGATNRAISPLTARRCGAAAGSTPRRCTWSRRSPRNCPRWSAISRLPANEITAALALLKDLPLAGAIITGDAIFCQREILSNDHGRTRRLRVRGERQPARR